MQFRRIPGMTLPMPLVPGTEAMLTPPAAEPVELDDEGTGDSWDLGDCAPEGAALDALADDALAEHRRGETEPMVPDRLPQIVALMLRVRRLNERVLHLTDLVTGLGLTVEVQTREIADLKAWIVELQGRMAA